MSRLKGKSATAFRTISEVSDELEVPQHVLRFWETKFSQVHPMKRGGGRRYYRPEDVDLLRRIRNLLYQDGYTIKGVQKLLREGGAKAAPSAREQAGDPTEQDGFEPPQVEQDRALDPSASDRASALDTSNENRATEAPPAVGSTAEPLAGSTVGPTGPGPTDVAGALDAADAAATAGQARGETAAPSQAASDRGESDDGALRRAARDRAALTEILGELQALSSLLQKGR
tara:strand:+ start:1136 stop:1825 length:690 start_codon:yes stop_codon:yes gene_type:complete